MRLDVVFNEMLENKHDIFVDADGENLCIRVEYHGFVSLLKINKEEAITLLSNIKNCLKYIENEKS